MSKARYTLDALSMVNAPDDGKTYLRKFNNWEEAPVVGYALLDFGTVTNNNRYVQTNPFGNDSQVLCKAEIMLGGVWHKTGHYQIYSGSTVARFISSYSVEGAGIVVQTGYNALIESNSYYSGGTYGTYGSNLTSAPCQVHVWRLAV